MGGFGYEFGRFDAEKLWRYQVRYRLARRLIHIALFVMPEGRYKTELLECLWLLYDKVQSASSHNPPLEKA